MQLQSVAEAGDSVYSVVTSSITPPSSATMTVNRQRMTAPRDSSVLKSPSAAMALSLGSGSSSESDMGQRNNVQRIGFQPETTYVIRAFHVGVSIQVLVTWF